MRASHDTVSEIPETAPVRGRVIADVRPRPISYALADVAAQAAIEWGTWWRKPYARRFGDP